MMTTLLLRLAGPWQSWGTRSRFDVRDTEREPSKSGVIGLLCAAMGKPQVEHEGDGFPRLADLAALRMGVRVDAEGIVSLDYQTAGGSARADEPYRIMRASGKLSTNPVQSNRYYLADASFLVGLEGSRPLLERLDQALRTPVWVLYLGRKGFVPGSPVQLPGVEPDGPGLRDESLEVALESYPWPERKEQLRLVMDTNDPTAGIRSDVPIDFATRSFAPRHISVSFLRRP